MSYSQVSCIHTHTNFCDGKDEIETCCNMAYQKGLSSLGICAHAPIGKKTGITASWTMKDDRLEEYLEAVNTAKKRWAGKLKLYAGLEVDFITALMGPADRDYREMCLGCNLDYIIGAVHFVVPPKGPPFTVDNHPREVDKGMKEGYGGDPMGMVEAYLDAMEEMIGAGGFNVLAHPDVIKKNNTSPEGQVNSLFSEDSNYYKSRIKTLAELMGKLAEDQFSVTEVNTGGLNRGRIKECYPSPHFLKLLREHGVRAVINSDAHIAEHIGGYHNEARKALLDAGYTETVLFGGRQGGRAVWNSATL